MNKLKEAPIEIQKEIISDINSALRGNEGLDREQTIEEIQKQISYSLRMFWLKRVDKLNSRKIPAYEWITKAYAPELLANTYQWNGRDIPSDGNQATLAKDVLLCLLNDYLEDPVLSSDFPPKQPEKKSLIAKLKKMF